MLLNVPRLWQLQSTWVVPTCLFHGVLTSLTLQHYHAQWKCDTAIREYANNWPILQNLTDILVALLSFLRMYMHFVTNCSFSMWQDMRKGTTSCISQIFILKCFNISGTIAAMNFNPGMNVLTSSCYTSSKLRAPPTSGVGEANKCVDCVRKSPFYASLWRLTARNRRLAVASNIGSVK